MDSLEREYKGNKLNFGKTFAIDSGKGSNYTGHFVINDSGKPMPVWFTDGTSKSYQKYLKFYIADAGRLDCEMKIDFPESITKQFNGSIQGDNRAYFYHEGKRRYGNGVTKKLDDLIGKFKSLKAVITVEFEPGPQMIYREKFKNYVNSFLVFKPDGKGEDFQIACKGEVYGFNKSILCNISPVFERMLTNPNFKQSQECLTEIKDTNPEIIKAFKNVLTLDYICLLYTSPSPRDLSTSRMPSSA